jgi:hypothetical protein
MGLRKLISCTALMMLSAVMALGQTGSKEKEIQAKQTMEAGPTNVGRFRVTLTGFTVNRQTSDNILESDGKGDEVFILADVAQYDNYFQYSLYDRFNRTPSVIPLVAPLGTYNDLIIRGGQVVRHSFTSAVMGDVNGHGAPSRIQAGSASSLGGLRTGDRFPTNEPWNLTIAWQADRPPMLLWEGELRRGQDLAVIIPSIWEWDGGNPQLRAQYGAEITRFFTDQVYQNHTFSALSFIGGDAFGAGDRPIGMVGRNTWAPQGLLLNFDNAQWASTNLPSPLGTGVVEIHYAAEGEDYSLYFKIERLR